MGPTVKTLLTRAPIFRGLVIAAVAVTIVAAFRAVTPSGGTSPLPTTGPATYVAPPVVAVPAPTAPAPTATATAPGAVSRNAVVGRPLVDTSRLPDAPRAPPTPQHAVAPGAVSTGFLNPRPVIEP